MGSPPLVPFLWPWLQQAEWGGHVGDSLPSCPPPRDVPAVCHEGGAGPVSPAVGGLVGAPPTRHQHGAGGEKGYLSIYTLYCIY